MTDIALLYDRYASDVYRFALYLCGNFADAEDITSETFVRAWTATGPLEMTTIKGYLFAIARNLYLMGLRRGTRQVALDPEVPEHDPPVTIDPQRDLAGRASLARVVSRLQDLPEPDRAALLMRSLEEIPYEEIAKLLGLSTGAVKVKVHRARRALAEVR